MFIVFSKMHLIDTYWVLILPNFFSAYGTFLLRQFFISIPKSLEDSVKIDGGGYWIRFLNIIVPLSKPAFATLCIFTFLYQWNNFLWPLLVTNTVKMKTLPVGITYFISQVTVYWNLLMAAATFAMIPMLIVYLMAQKYFVAGITLTGMKS
jgi:multiple sugar transport system permease protein